MKASIIKSVYGIGNYPVITLNKHDGSEPKSFYPKDGMVSVELIEEIGKLLSDGVEIEYNHNPTVSDIKNI